MNISILKLMFDATIIWVSAVWQVLAHWPRMFVDFLNMELKNGVTWKDMIERSTFRVCDIVTGTYPNLVSEEFLLIHNRCSKSKSVNHISDYDFKGLSWSVLLKWQVRICCEVIFRLCILLLEVFWKFSFSFEGCVPNQ